MEFLQGFLMFTGAMVWVAALVVLFLIWIGKVEVGVQKGFVEREDD
jgi:hypothetical protein